jgi:hypothetical protein
VGLLEGLVLMTSHSCFFSLSQCSAYCVLGVAVKCTGA